MAMDKKSKGIILALISGGLGGGIAGVIGGLQGTPLVRLILLAVLLTGLIFYMGRKVV